MKLNSINGLATIGLAMTVSSAALAAGTAPNTTITNTIDLSYDINGTTASEPAAASSSFVVDRKVAFTLDSQDASNNINVAPGNDDQVLTYRLENTGNDTSGYDIDLNQLGTMGLSYDATESGAEGTYYVTIGDNAAPDPSDVSVTPAGLSTIGDLAADDVKYIFIHAFISESSANGDSAIFEVTVIPLDAGGSTQTVEDRTQGIAAVDTVFADADQDGTETETATMTLTAPELTTTKTSDIISENLDGTFSCSSGSDDPSAAAYIPGSCVEYTVTITNSATAGASADNLTVTDNMPAGITFAASDAGDFDSVTHNAGVVTGTISSVPIDSSASFTFRVTID